METRKSEETNVWGGATDVVAARTGHNKVGHVGAATRGKGNKVVESGGGVERGVQSDGVATPETAMMLAEEEGGAELREESGASGHREGSEERGRH